MKNLSDFNLSEPISQQKRRVIEYHQPSLKKVREEQVLSKFGPNTIKQMTQKWNRITNWL